jgi:hypothetical protein
MNIFLFLLFGYNIFVVGKTISNNGDGNTTDVDFKQTAYCDTEKRSETCSFDQFFSESTDNRFFFRSLKLSSKFQRKGKHLNLETLSC